MQQNLQKLHAVDLFRLQRSILNKLLEFLMVQCITGTYAKRMGMRSMVNNFCRSWGDDKEKVTILRLFGSCSALCVKRWLLLRRNPWADLCWHRQPKSLHWKLQMVSIRKLSVGLNWPKSIRAWGDCHFYLSTYHAYISLWILTPNCYFLFFFFLLVK